MGARKGTTKSANAQPSKRLDLFETQFDYFTFTNHADLAVSTLFFIERHLVNILKTIFDNKKKKGKPLSLPLPLTHSHSSLSPTLSSPLFPSLLKTEAGCSICLINLPSRINLTGCVVLFCE